MKKYFLFLLFFIFPLQANADAITKYIKQTDFDLKSTVSIDIEEQKGDVIYKKNENKLLNPASILKVLTFGAAYLTLGENYEFETSLYKDSNDNLYLKLSGDTLLTKENLYELFKKYKETTNSTSIKNLYIDDSIMDKTPYPKGWMEDDIWPNSRPISAYIVDDNYTKIIIKRSSLSTRVDILQDEEYKIPVINELKIGDEQNIKITKMYGDKTPLVGLSGTVAEDEIINLPVLTPEIAFKIKVQNAINKNKIKNLNMIKTAKVPNDAEKVASVKHDIKEISKNILHNSDNFSAEVIFKAAGAKYINYSKSAEFDDSVSMFKDVYKNEITQDITIVDGSGVSRYNLINTNFYVNALRKLFEDENFKALLATSNQGTLKDRLLFLENNLRAKTGTLSGMSSFAGGLTTKKGKNVLFAIIIQNSPKRKAVLKNFENSIIGIIYRKY